MRYREFLRLRREPSREGGTGETHGSLLTSSFHKAVTRLAFCLNEKSERFKGPKWRKSGEFLENQVRSNKPDH